MTLTQTAPAGGSSVTLASNNTSLTVPASVTVAAGATTATFSATAAPIASNQSATVTATLGSSSQTATISLLAPVLVSGVACSPTSLGAERGQHLHGDADPDRSGRRIERDAGEQQHFAHRTGIGDGSGGSDDGDLQRDSGGFHRQQSERDRNRDPRQQFADGDHQSAGAGAGLGGGLQSDESRAERGQHLHGDADPGRSGRRIERDAGEQQHFAHRTGIGDVAAGATTATFSATAAASIASNQSATVTATLGSSSQTATISLLAPVLVSGVACSPDQSRAERGQHLHGDADPDRPGGRLERDAGEQQRFAHRAGIGDSSGGSDDRDLQRDRGGIDRKQSERDRDGDPGQQLADATISLLAPVLVSGVACSPTSLGQSAVSTCTVTLTQTAPAGGSSVTLASNNTSLTVPASVTVAAGARPRPSARRRRPPSRAIRARP